MIIRLKALRYLPILLLAAFSISSCSGPKGTGGCTTNCTGGSGNISFTLVADTLPTHPTILSFTIAVLGVTVTSSTSTKSLTPPSAPIDLMRLQSDSAFLGTLTGVPNETISSLSVALDARQLTFLNDTGVALTSPSCAVNAVCTFSPSATGAVLINNVNQVFSSNIGFGLDFNLANAITVTGSTLTVNFINSGTTNVLTEFVLPRDTNLASGQLELIEDVTGVAAVNGQNATISNPLTLATLTAAATSSTNFDTDPTGGLCPTTTMQTLATCVSNNQIASMDVVLHTDGSLSIQQIEPLFSTQQDFVEGIVIGVTSGSSTQFTLVVRDILPAASNSLVGTGLLHLGDGLTVNLVNAVNFLIDDKGLNLSAFSGNLTNFTGTNNTSALHTGQVVVVHVTSFTPASGTTVASSNANLVVLRWSRFTASVFTASSPAFNINAFPVFFSSPTPAQVQTFTGTQGAAGVSNLDGITSTANLSTAKPVSLRALLIQNAGKTLTPGFYAAKIRQH